MDDKLAQCLITLAERTMTYWREADMRGDPVITIPDVIYDHASQALQTYTMRLPHTRWDSSGEIPASCFDFSIVGVKFKRQQEPTP